MNSHWNYLPHLSEDIHLQIAKGYIQHEMRKLFPSLSTAPAVWQLIETDIDNWSTKNGLSIILPIRDLWNMFYAISSVLKLKSVLPLLTSVNITWSKKNIPVSSLTFGSKFPEIEPMRCIHQPANVVRKCLFDDEHKTELEKIRVRLAGQASAKAPRDHYPLIAKVVDENTVVIDGNRRLLNALVNNIDSINVVQGQPCGKPEIFEHWVPTIRLIECVQAYRSHYEINPGGKSQAITIYSLIRNSQAGRIEFFERAISKKEPADNYLCRMVRALLRH